jgi:FAD/FMN-containing dehydrogenase
VALPGLEAAGRLFDRANGCGGGLLSAFELLPRIGIEFVTRHAAGIRDPFAEPHPWYALVELDWPFADGSAVRLAEEILQQAAEAGEAADAVIAASQAQAGELWRLRELMSEVQKHEGGSIKHDVSVPVADIPRFIVEASAEVVRIVPGARPVPFGHYGDGNIHFNVSQPPGADTGAFLARWDEVSDAVHGVVLRLGGSISAEHGIGQMKAELLERVKSPVELAMMRAVKDALDPRGILNPGKVLRRRER